MATPQNMDNSAANTNWPCSYCGKVFTTNAKVKQHERRVCSIRSLLPNNPNNECPTCKRKFPTYAGLRLHQSKAHATAYNAELEAQSANARRNWTLDEERELAIIEAGLAGRSATEIIDELSKNSSRTRDAIKKRRQLASYQTLVSSFIVHPTEPTTPPPPYGNDDTSTLDIEIKSYLNTIPINTMDAEDREVYQRLFTGSGILDSTKTLLDNIIRKYGKDRTTRQNSFSGLINALNNARSERKKKSIRYALAQKEYNSNKSAYAERLLDAKPWCSQDTTPPATELISQFRSTFGLFAECGLPDCPSTIYEPMLVARPITIEDITATIKLLKSKAAGPDGIGKPELCRIPTSKLALLFNAFLLAEQIPDELKNNLTTLIPKSSDGLENPKNWRPITISSIILRCFNKIMASRLMNINLKDCQRGFTKIDGCFANTWSIETLIKHHRAKGIPLTLISLDLTAAFDSVPHDAIARALKRVNVDGKYINLVKACNTGSRTNISCNGIEVGTVPMLRGVRQGDPASPVHFNIFMDELICLLNNEFTGITVNEEKLCCLAYADDFVLIAKTPEDARRMLNRTISFLTSMCMSLNAKKCSAIVLRTVPAKKKVFIDTNVKFSVGNEDIPLINTNNNLRYLGRYFHYRGLTPCNTKALYDQLNRVKRAPLKPAQKLSIIKEFLIPRFIDHFQQPNITHKTLLEADRKIRLVLRRILHINAHSHCSIFHAPIRDGGLGIFCLADNIPTIIIKRIEKLCAANNLLNATLKLAETRINNIRRMIKTGSEGKVEIQEKHAKLLEESFSGNGLWQARHSTSSSSYISNPPKCWSGEDYVRAVQLRYNMLPCAGIPSNPPDARFCRAGCPRRETVSHILQKCPLTHTTRIARHNYVVKRITTFIGRHGWTYLLEPNIRCSDGILKKPDIIMMKNNTLIISDVGVNWEGPLSLDFQYNNKVAIYSTATFIDAIQQRFPSYNIHVLPLIVGARGIWCKRNNYLKHHLRLPKVTVNDIITTTIRGSCTSHRDFMKFVWRTRPPQQRNIQ